MAAGAQAKVGGMFKELNHEVYANAQRRSVIDYGQRLPRRCSRPERPSAKRKLHVF